LPAVSKDAAWAAPHVRPWFETRGRCPRSASLEMSAYTPM
jgi:hypothetical protein